MGGERHIWTRTQAARRDEWSPAGRSIARTRPTGRRRRWSGAAYVAAVTIAVHPLRRCSHSAVCQRIACWQTQRGTVSGWERSAPDTHRASAALRVAVDSAPSSSPPSGLASESGPHGPGLPIPLAQTAQSRFPPMQLVQHYLGGLRHGGRGRQMPIRVKTLLNEGDGD